MDDWERTLVRYFLAIGPEGDASDIHAFEVSPRTLALACGVDPSRKEEIEDAFRAALLRDQASLLRALKNGPQRRPSTDVPNCFAPLAMTLLIDILLEGTEYVGNQFRAKLADWLRMDRTFNDLSGVKLMWEAVARWLDSRVAQGAPYRRLVLPVHPENWRHIGYTRRLSFPSRADVKALAQVLAAVPKSEQDNPVAVIDAAAQLASRKSVSIGLKEAYADFVQSYYSRRRAIADHRFWCLVVQARMAGGRPRQVAMLEISLTADDEREFHVMREHAEEARVHLTLSAALRDETLITSANLGPAVGRGLLFFRQVGLGCWKAEPDLAKCRDRVLVAYHDRFTRPLGRRLGSVEKDGQWSLTVDLIDAGKVATELRTCGAMTDAKDRLFRPAASDGVRVYGGVWLGLPGFLPSIDADTNNLRVISDGAETTALWPTAADGVKLVSESPVVGAFLVEPRLLGRESRPPWRLSLQFVDRAVPHLELGGVRRRRPPLKDWDAMRRASVACDLPHDFTWGRAQDAMEWLLEALYASGASGWDESDLVSLVRRAGPEAALVPWRTLRMLQEGGVIEPRLRQGWKGRVWTLVPPRVVAAWNNGVPAALAEGALCAQMVEAFAIATTGMGGKPFRMPGHMRWSVPVTGATDVNPEALARVLRWEFVGQPETPSRAPLALAASERRAENYVAAFVWCWRARRFVQAGAVEGRVRLIQLSHPAATDHDVYRVECDGRRWHFLSRQAAIVAAHAVARVSLMVFAGDRIQVTARDGGLPDALATALRRRRLASGGFTEGCYGYPATAEDVSWLAMLLPSCIAGVPEDAVPKAGEVLSRARRSGGAVRPQWRSGRLAL